MSFLCNKIGTYIFCFLFYLFSAKAQQNMVLNPSFEDNQNYFSVFQKDSSPVRNWCSPNSGTPDYYLVSSKNSAVGVLEKHAAYCYTPHSGNAVFGLGLISKETGCMEHIQGRLVSPLTAGKKYEVSFWVLLAYQFSDYVAYNIGLYFSNKEIFHGDPWQRKDNYRVSMNSDFTAHVKNKKNQWILDTIWVQITGSYIAKGGEKYVTIGMFWDDNSRVVKALEKAQKNGSSFMSPKPFEKAIKKYCTRKNKYMKKEYRNLPFKAKQHSPYYFVDDVSVIPIE